MYTDVIEAKLAEYKLCSRCKEVRRLTEFNVHRQRTDGRQRQCRYCNIEYLKQWRKTSPDKYAEDRNRYRARKANAEVPLTLEERDTVRRLYSAAKWLTQNTGTAYHVDHIIPLCKGGLHHPDNLRVITAEANLRKGGRLEC
jgi:hypothetical protein